MPLKTPEEKSKAVQWLLKQLKVFGVTVGLALSTVWGASLLYLEDYVEGKIQEHQQKIEEEERKSKPFREILGEALHVPSEVVPYHIAEKMIQFDSLISDVNEFEDEYLPILKAQQTQIWLIRYIELETGEERVWMPDGRNYPVHYDQSGQDWVLYHGYRRNL